MSGAITYAKGPWVVHGVGVQETINVQCRWGVIARLTTQNMPRDIQAANAHLIAASPDLRDAVRGLLDMLEGTPFIDSHEAGVAFAAIAKSEGR